MGVNFYKLNYPAYLKYSVIVSKDDNGWVFVKHKNRDTWEIPGGHIEDEETPLEAARRELQEETGAKEYSIEEVCIYSVTRGSCKSFGALFFAKISKYSGSLDYEINEVKSFYDLPAELTYPEIQPELFNKVTASIFKRR